MNATPPTEDDLTVSVGIPLGWIPLKPEGDVDAWALESVTTRAPQARPRLARAAAKCLAEAFTVTRSKNGVVGAALALQPDPVGDVIAVWSVELIPAGPEPMTLEEIVGHLTADAWPGANESLTRMQLPLGEACRHRAIWPEQRRVRFRRRMVESVTHALPLPSLEALVLMKGRWSDLVLGDELAVRIDDLAISTEINF